MKTETRYLVKEDSPNDQFTHALKHITAGELYTCFAGNSAEECEKWARDNDYDVVYGAPDLPTRFDIAKMAWEDVGDCELTGWKVGDGPTDYVKAYGTPPRCRKEYVHVFVFHGRWLDGGYANVLTSVLRAPWDETIRWRGSSPNNRRHLYKYVDDNDQYAMM